MLVNQEVRGLPLIRPERSLRICFMVDAWGTSVLGYFITGPPAAARPDSDSSTPISGTALGMGNRNDENDLVFLLVDHGIGKLRQHASARIHCVD